MFLVWLFVAYGTITNKSNKKILIADNDEKDEKEEKEEENDNVKIGENSCFFCFCD